MEKATGVVTWGCVALGLLFAAVYLGFYAGTPGSTAPVLLFTTGFWFAIAALAYVYGRGAGGRAGAANSPRRYLPVAVVALVALIMIVGLLAVLVGFDGFGVV